MNQQDRPIQPATIITGALVWLIAFVVYYLTKAPTISFWDCGEFIAAGYTLGIPHPPGTPLYVLGARLFSMLPIADDPAVRINLLSVVCSSFAALFLYLTGRRILVLWYGDVRDNISNLLIHAGAASGALLAALSLTNWNNSVEAEVYGMSMLLMTAIFWLSIRAWEKRGSLESQRLMLLVFFLSFIGIGVHMATFLVVPVAVLYFLIKRDAPSWVWYLMGIFFALELYLIFAMSSRPGEVPFYLPVFIVLLIYLFYIFSFDAIARLHIFVAGVMIVAALPIIVPALNTVLPGDPLGGGIASVLSILSIAAFVALLAFAAWAGYTHGPPSKRTDVGRDYITAAGFIAVAAFMVAATFTIKGYIPFLIVSAFLMAVVVFAIWRYLVWTSLAATVGVALVMLGIYELFWGFATALVALLIMGPGFRMSGWRTALMILVVSALGFSVHLFIPIRSAQHPTINENNPSESFTATINYLERKQYGSESMIERMFERRGEWENQFGDHRRMGLWGFFQEQYGLNQTRFIIPFLIGLFGLWEIIRRRPRFGLPLAVLILICTVGLVLYMNFADGTRTDVDPRDYLEVRDRDYFFTPGFVFFGLAIGLGLTALVQALRDALQKSSPGLQKIAVYASLVLFLSPVYALANNYHYADRSGNFIPYDYAHNLLHSCDPNAIMFTSGDNDTFPVWALQEVYKVRTDVRCVNLSLANTHWYVWQIRDYMGLELGWTDEQIKALRPYRDQNGVVHRIADQVVDALIMQHLGEIPIHFAVTSGSGVRRFRGQSLDTLCELNGLMWRLTEDPKGLRVALPEAYDYFMTEFQGRSLNNPDVYKTETAHRLTNNYASGIIRVGDALRRAEEYDKAERLGLYGVKLLPQADNLVDFVATIYERSRRIDQLAALIDTVQYGDRRQMQLYLARAYRAVDSVSAAERVLETILIDNPNFRPAFDELVRLYISQRQFSGLHRRLTEWLEVNPGDREAAGLLKQLEAAADTIVQDTGMP